MVVFSPSVEWRRVCSGVCFNGSGTAGKMVRMSLSYGEVQELNVCLGS